MKRTIMRTCVAASLAGLTIACGGAGEETSESGEALEWQFVEREYPYWMSEDTLVCARWELMSRTGEVVDARTEWYPINTMNRHLRNVGTLDAVAHVDAGFRDALLQKGISGIETCDQAREFVRIGEERTTWRAPSELNLPPQQAEQLPEPDLEEVDKIIVGSNFDHASTVGIKTTMGNCTGNLIGPFSMVTAAHCVPGTGYFALNAWIQTSGGAQQCISNTAGGTCPALGAANVYIQRHPNYNGSTADFDQAVVIINPGWRSPANTSARWTRLAANWGLPLYAGMNASPVRIDGYGVNTADGQGVGLGRRGNSTHTITTINDALTVFQMPRVDSTWSASCGGDSGMGPYNITLISGGSNLMLGVLRGATSVIAGGGKCTSAGANMVFSIPDGGWVSNLVTFFGGSCSTGTAGSGQPFLRCW